MNRKSRSKTDTLRLGVDTGGTFTDFVFSVGGERRIFKLASTPDDPSRAITAGLRRIVGETGATLRSIEVVHGTTVGTNALLQRRGARVPEFRPFAAGGGLDADLPPHAAAVRRPAGGRLVQHAGLPVAGPAQRQSALCDRRRARSGLLRLPPGVSADRRLYSTHGVEQFLARF